MSPDHPNPDRPDLFDPQPQPLLMTMFGAYLKPRSTPVWSGGLVTALGLFGASTASSRVALARMVDRDLLTRKWEGRLAYYVLTEHGLSVLDATEERIYALRGEKVAPLSWTIVWHSISDDRKAERSQFVQQLRFFGFGPLNDGTWIAPRDLVREVRGAAGRLGIGDALAVFRAAPDDDIMNGPLPQQVWDLDAVAKRYRRFISAYEPLASRAGRLSEEEAFLECTRLVHAFRSFASVDPEIPLQVAPHAPERNVATHVYLQCLKQLKEPAAAYFQQIMQPHSA